MNEVKFKANKKDVEAIGEKIQEATAALDTTDATGYRHIYFRVYYLD